MVRDGNKLREFEDKFLVSSNMELQQKFVLYESLLAEARELGHIPSTDPLEGLEHKIRFIKILNAI